MREEDPLGQMDSCESPSQRSVLTVAEAQGRIRTFILPLLESERVSLKASLSRVLGMDVVAPINVPPHDNSAMDGYALRSADLPKGRQCRLKVIGIAMAGAPFNGEVTAGQCVRIMTGGVIPRGCDTIVAQEEAQRDDDFITIGADHARGQHVRPAGEDIGVGQIILKSGKRITPADLGLLASLGIDTVSVMRRPRVAFFSTGDELRGIGETLAEGDQYDSNRYTLYGMLLQIGVEPLDLGAVRDDRDALRHTLTEAAAHADAVITSGGVSVGDADLVRETLASLGEVHFWKVGIKPGRPFAFGRIGQAWFFGLPGNPVSTMATYYQFVQPALRHLMGELDRRPLQFKVPCGMDLKKSPGRMEFQRGILETNAQGETTVRSTGAQGSNILRSMSIADCFIILPAEWGDVPAGTLVDVQPFAGL